MLKGFTIASSVGVPVSVQHIDGRYLAIRSRTVVTPRGALDKRLRVIQCLLCGT